jgi:hypothetical protein
MIEINQENYPTLHQLFNLVAHDNGDGAGHARFLLHSDGWQEDLQEIEAAVAALSTEEQVEFAIGVEHIALDIAGRSLELHFAHMLLNEWMEGRVTYE